MSGLIKQPMVMIRNEYRGASWQDVAVAVHEAAHAVVAALVGFRVTGVSIDRANAWGAVGGKCRYTLPDGFAGAVGVRGGLVAAAGAASVALLDGALAVNARHDETLTRIDRERMDEAYEQVRGPAAGRSQTGRVAFEHESRRAAETMLRRNAKHIDRLAGALLTHRRLTGDQVYAVLGIAPPDIESDDDDARVA